MTALLAAEFPERVGNGAPSRASALTPHQREFLDSLASDPGLFEEAKDGYTHVFGTQAAMRAYHLPPNADLLRKWLDGADLTDCIQKPRH